MEWAKIEKSALKLEVFLLGSEHGGFAMKLLISLLFCSLLFAVSSNASAQCNQQEAVEVINMVTQGGLADRQDNPDSITVWYIWHYEWERLPKGQKYKLISGLGAAEQCLKPGRATRIRVAGEDVARFSSTGKVYLLDE